MYRRMTAQARRDREILRFIAQFDENAPTPPFDASTLSDDDLTAELSRVQTRGAELSALETLDADGIAELDELAVRMPLITAEQSARAERTARTQSHRDMFAAVPADAGQGEQPAGSTTPAAVEPPPAVTAATPPPVVPSVAQMAPAPQQTPPAPARRSEFSITLSPDGAGALGRSYGEEVNVSDVARAVAKSFQAYGSAHAGGTSAKRAIAQFTRNRGGAELTMTESDYGTVQGMIREGSLSGGSLLNAWRSNVDAGASLTAAAGWCAPSENLYDLCSLWSMDGMLDLPTATARRGGFNYVQSQPSFATIDAATSFTILTEAQVIADTPKNCAEIPCPTFTDTRLDVAVTCITGSFLQTAGYPEMVETWVDGTLTNHAHKLNENIISRIVTFAGATNLIPAQGVVTGTGATGLAGDSSVTASVLSAADLAATDIRYRERMSFRQTVEIVLPMWVLTQMRADVSRKNGWSAENAALTDQQIVNWFSVRNIRPQFVYDWQDAYSGLAAGPGGATDLLVLPTTVQFLAYPAGAVVLARQDVVTLSNVYDSTNLTQNLYTRLFAEEGFNLLFPCGEVRLYTAQACPSGATASQAYTACVAPATGA